MRGLKLSILLGGCITLSGCSSIWSGVADFADFMSEKTEFLSLRKSKTDREIVTADATPNQDGLIRSSAGYYAPTGWETSGTEYSDATMTSTSYAYGNTSPDGCPEGSYLTAENSCMLMASDDYNLPPLQSYSSVATSDSYFPECPDNTYLTAENTCMHFDTDPLPTLAGGVSENYGHFETSYSEFQTCPEGSYLAGNNECRLLDSGPIVPEIDNPYSLTPSTSSVSSLDVTCPEGTYKDPENFCMRFDSMP